VAIRHDYELMVWRDEQMITGWNVHEPTAVQFYGKPFERNGVTKVFDFFYLHSAKGGNGYASMASFIVFLFILGSIRAGSTKAVL